MIRFRPSQQTYLHWLPLLVCFSLADAALAQGTLAPQSPQAEILEGRQLLQAGQASQAKLKFDAALALSPRSADALTWRGICENQLQQYASAVADFNAALHINGTMLAAHYNLALSLIRLRKADAAIAQLQIVIASQPAAVPAIYNLAILLEAKGSFAEAADRLRAAHTLAPADQGVTLHLLLDTLRVTPSADVASLLGDLAGDATATEILCQAGAALLEAGRFSDALRLLQIASQRPAPGADVDLLLARALLGNSQGQDALSLLKSPPHAAVGDPSTSRYAHPEEERAYLLGLAYLATGSSAEGEAQFAEARSLDPTDARPLYQLALVASAKPQGQVHTLDLLRAAHLLAPTNTTYALAYARLLLASDQAQEAEAVLEQMPETESDRAQRAALLGVAMAATHQVEKAEVQLERALTLDPTLALAANVLGFCHLQQGQYAQAAEAYGRASKLDPQRGMYARDAAVAYQRSNQLAQALQFAERATALPNADAHDHALLGELYAGAGRQQEAVRELLRAAELDPEFDTPPYLLARTYQQIGDRQKALQWSQTLALLKQKHEAAFALQKQAAAAQIRSSVLLEGGSLATDHEGGP